MQLPVVSITLFIESFELDNAESCLCKALGVLLGALPDGVGEAIGGGVDGGIEVWIKGKDGLSRHRRDWWVFLLGDAADEGGLEDSRSICRRRDFHKSGAVGRLRG